MSEKKRWIILVSLSLLVAIGLGVMIFMQYKKIDERRDQIASLKTNIEKDRETIKKTPDLIKEVIIQRETDVTIKEILSDDEDINNFVRTLRKFEEDSGISISSIKQQRGRNRKGKEDFGRVGYTLNFDADAFQLMSFTSLVESHSRLMSVTAEGALLYEIMMGDPRAVPADKAGFEALCKERGVEPLPNPPLEFPDWVGERRD